MDLDDSISCCKILMEKIDAVVSRLHRTPSEGTLLFTSKMKLVFGSTSIDGVQKLIENQTNALTLLLTAVNRYSFHNLCRTQSLLILFCSNALSEQKSLLQKSSTRKLFRKVEHDSALLIALRDADSLLSCQTDTLSKLSMIFTSIMYCSTLRDMSRSFEDF